MAPAYGGVSGQPALLLEAALLENVYSVSWGGIEGGGGDRGMEEERESGRRGGNRRMGRKRGREDGRMVEKRVRGETDVLTLRRPTRPD